MKITEHTELEVYRKAFAAAMAVFDLSKSFPREETYSLTDQIRRSSRSVAANLAEAWRKRRYEGAFISKLSDAEAEAAETQTWLQFSQSCGYASPAVASRHHESYDCILRMIVSMIAHKEKWLLRDKQKRSGGEEELGTSREELTEN